MGRIWQIISNRFTEKNVILVTFCVMFCVGLLIFGDYGATWDEPSHLFAGRWHYDFVFHNVAYPQGHDIIYYGPIYDFVCYLISRALLVEDTHSAFLLKHFLNFTYFFASVVFFYFLCKGYFGNWVPAYVASLLLFLHPRIFADSFYNPKDLPFLASFVIACYTLYLFDNRKSLSTAIIHGLATAVCIDIRVLGVLVLCMTFVILTLDSLRRRPNADSSAQNVKLLLTYGLTAVLFTVCFWPYLWSNPALNFMEALSVMSNFWRPGHARYFGEFVEWRQLPWHYIPVQIVITTPIAVVVAFIIGLLQFPKHLTKSFSSGSDSLPAVTLLPYMWFGIPVLAVISLKSVVYDSWRQLFFIYPAIVMISVSGLMWICELVRRDGSRITTRGLAYVAFGFILFDLGSTTWFMIQHHPYQNVYFSPIVGGLRGANGQFDLDYWGTSYKTLYDCVLRRSAKKNGTMYVMGDHLQPAMANWMILAAQDRSKILVVGSEREVPAGHNYLFLTTFRFFPAKWNTESPQICSVEVDGVRLAGAFVVESGKRMHVF